jgi:hypothetical protein
MMTRKKLSTGPSDVPEVSPMTPTEPIPPMDSLDSDHHPRSSRRGLVTALIAVLALVAAGVSGAALAGGGGGAGDEAALAASGSTSTATPAPRHKALKRGPGMLRGRGHLLGMGGALHGSFVVPDGSGGYRTVVMQRGAATSVSDTSITVRSEDGFEQTYAITAGTAVGADRQGVSGIAKGADVAVMGEKKGSGVTALHVADLAQFGRGIGPGGIGPGGMRMDGPDNDAPPAPTAPSATEGSADGA